MSLFNVMLFQVMLSYILLHILLLYIYLNCFISYKEAVNEAVVPRCSVQKVFLEISQNSQEGKHLCQRVSFFNKVGIMVIRISQNSTASCLINSNQSNTCPNVFR